MEMSKIGGHTWSLSEPASERAPQQTPGHAGTHLKVFASRSQDSECLSPEVCVSPTKVNLERVRWTPGQGMALLGLALSTPFPAFEQSMGSPEPGNQERS